MDGAIEIGLRIRRLREIRGKTQADFASEIGMNLRSYQNLEAGKTTRMSLYNMFALVGMGLDLEELRAHLQTIDGCPIPPDPEEGEWATKSKIDKNPTLSATPQTTVSTPKPLKPPKGKIQTLLEQRGSGEKNDLQALPPSLQDLDLMMLEFQAWAKRTVGRSPEALAKIERGIRRLINEVEGVS